MIKTIAEDKDLALCQLSLRHVPDLAKHANNKEITKYMFQLPYPYQPKDAAGYVKRNQAAYRRKLPDRVGFAIRYQGEIIRSIISSHIQPKHLCTIGYWIGQDYWGQGLGTRVVKMMTDYLFRRFELKRIEAFVYDFNPASARILEKSGFKREGLMRKKYYKNGKYIDAYMYAKVR